MEGISAQRNFYEWMIRWVSSRKYEDQEADLPPEEWDKREKPDVASIACLLQAVGFKLRSFEKVSGAEESEKLRPGKIKVSIECGTSRMTAILEMERMKCKCINFDDKNASFWSISGTGPSGSMDNVNKVDETGSNFLPLVSKNTTVLLRDVTYKLFQIIEGEPDINRNTRANLNNANYKTTVGIARSRTEPEIKRAAFDFSSTYLSNSSLPVATRKRPVRPMRQETWNVDENLEKNFEDEPRPSPPKITSSPAIVGELCNSLGQISLQSDDQDANVTAYLIGAYRQVGKALGILFANKKLGSSKSSLYGSNAHEIPARLIFHSDESEPSKSLENFLPQIVEDSVTPVAKPCEPIPKAEVTIVKTVTDVPSILKPPTFSPVKSKIGVIRKPSRKSIGSFANDLDKDSPRLSQSRGQAANLKLAKRRTMSAEVGVPSSSLSNSNSSIASGNSLKMNTASLMKNKDGKQTGLYAELQGNRSFGTVTSRKLGTPDANAKTGSGRPRTPSMLSHSKLSVNKSSQGKTPQQSRIPSPKVMKPVKK